LLGIIGGLSPYSTILYYKLLVEKALEKWGQHPDLIIRSIPIQRVSQLIRENNIDDLTSLLLDAARSLEKAGATLIIIAANTPHIAADRVASGLKRARLLSILDAVWARLEPLEPRRVGLLATGATVRYRLYHEYLESRGVEVITPPRPMQKVLDDMIRNVAKGLLDTRARLKLGPIIMSLLSRQVDAIILGCTELPLLMGGLRVRVPVVDSVDAHVDIALRVLDEELPTAHNSNGSSPDDGS